MSASYLSEPFQNTLTNLLGVWKQYQTNILIFSHLGGSWLTFIQLRPPEMMIQSVILINLSWDQLYSQLRIYTAYVVYRLVYFTSHGSVIQDTERGLDIYDSRIWSFCHMQFTSTGILFCFETNCTMEINTHMVQWRIQDCPKCDVQATFLPIFTYISLPLNPPSLWGNRIVLFYAIMCELFRQLIFHIVIVLWMKKYIFIPWWLYARKQPEDLLLNDDNTRRWNYRNDSMRTYLNFERFQVSKCY